jgi:PadR family transcriptional regulator, regulatory protein PadR
VKATLAEAMIETKMIIFYLVKITRAWMLFFQAWNFYLVSRPIKEQSEEIVWILAAIYAYIVGIMKKTEQDSLGEFEQLVLLAVLRLGEQAYAVTIRQEIEERTGRSVSRGAIYITLDRLEKKGYLDSRLGDATAERGGRSKRYYELRPVAGAALRESWSAMRKMWEGMEPVIKKI